MTISRRDFLGATAGAGIASLLAGCGAASPTVRSRPSLDLLIRGAGVLDGTGAAEISADVGIRDGKIAAVGNLGEASAGRIIAADGLKLTPGFIDIHSHVDTDIFLDPRSESKVRQGVTTEVSGQDGESPAPLGGTGMDRSLQEFRERYGIDCPYRDMAGFFDAIERKGTSQNLVSLIGLGTIRGAIVGFDNRPPTADELRAMQREVSLAVEQGCWGASTGLEYTPGSFASADELASVILAAPQRYRLYSTHLRNEADRLLEAIEEAISIARSSGSRLLVSHLKAQNKSNWDKSEKALRLLDDALTSGLQVYADRYPYLAFNTGLMSLFPIWSREGGTEKFLGRLRDASLRSRIEEEVTRKVMGLSSWDAVMIGSVRLREDKVYQGRTVQQIAAEHHVDPYEFIVDLLLREEGGAGMVGFGMDEEGTEKVLAWKNACVASDGGAYSPSRPDTQPHPRCYGTFPRAIAYYQRERQITTLPDMIRKMTALPAEVLGVKDRGVISPGKAADLVLFDYARIADRATFVEPHRFPEGILYVIVNGIPVVDGGRQTGALPGRVLRSS